MTDFLWLGEVSLDQKTLSLKCLRSGGTGEGLDRWEGAIAFSELRTKLKSISLTEEMVHFYDGHPLRFSLPASSRYDAIRKLGIDQPGYLVAFYCPDPENIGEFKLAESRFLNLSSESDLINVLDKARSLNWTRPYFFAGLFRGVIGVRVRNTTIDNAMKICTS